MKFYVTAFTALALLLSTTASHAEDERFDISTMSCWDLGLLEEQEAAYSMLLLYGYHAGTRNQNMISGSAIQQALEQVSERCQAEPDTRVIDILQ